MRYQSIQTLLKAIYADATGRTAIDVVCGEREFQGPTDPGRTWTRKGYRALTCSTVVITRALRSFVVRCQPRRLTGVKARYVSMFANTMRPVRRMADDF